MKVLNDLLEYNLKIYQDSDAFNFSLESAILPNFVSLKKGVKNILDVGCGNAPISLILSTRTNANIVGIEIQEDSYNLAIESIKINNKENQIKVINDDYKNITNYYPHEFFDVIVSNPPYFKLDTTKNKNIQISKQHARHEISLDLDQLIRISSKMLKNKGVFALVHQSERLSEIIKLMEDNKLTVKKIQFIHTKENIDAIRVLVEAVKNTGAGLKVLNPIIVHEADGSVKKEVRKLYFGGNNESKEL